MSHRGHLHLRGMPALINLFRATPKVPEQKFCEYCGADCDPRMIHSINCITLLKNDDERTLWEMGWQGEEMPLKVSAREGSAFFSGRDCRKLHDERIAESLSIPEATPPHSFVIA